ncbi:MAG: hypothetical protein Q8920_04255 [Bacillota bacterium]|nr:hypothetical protein [Bacillota bacterium]
MEKLEICSVQLIDCNKLNFKYKYPSYVALSKEDIDLLDNFGRRICDILVPYTNTTSEYTIFTSYYENKMISMDIDSLINKRISQQESQNLADLSVMVLNIVYKHFESQ